jgi:thiamine transport system permease protein
MKKFKQRLKNKNEILTTLILWLIPVGFLGFFFFYPLGSTFLLAARSFLSGGLKGNVWSHVQSPLVFTIWQAFLSTILTLIIGLPLAFVLARFQFRGKTWLRVIIMLPFILPTVVVATGFNALLGQNGWVNLVLMNWLNLTQPPIQIMNTLFAILLAHIFYNTTIIVRIVGSYLDQMDIRLEQAARLLGASQLRSFWEITFPMAIPAILSATLLVFLFDFTSFGVILIMGGPHFSTLETEIYIQAMQMLNLPIAGLLSAIQLIFTLLFLTVYTFISKGTINPVTPRLFGEGLIPIRKNWQKILLVLMLVVVVLFYLSPIAALAFRSIAQVVRSGSSSNHFSISLTLDYYRELFINRREALFYVPPIIAARNSFLYAAATTVISLSLGFLAVYALIRKSILSRLFDPLFMLPLGTSAVTLGLGFIIVFSRPPLDVRSFPLLIPIAHSLVALPFVIRTLQPAVESIPASYRQVATVLGASPWKVFREVDIPILYRTVFVAAIFAFTISLGEFGATSFLARPEFPTLPVAIYRFFSQPGDINYGQAMAMSTLLMIVCAACILVMENIQKIGRQMI